ncbi:MAG: nuclear transport factor 2 family protein [Burkholderiales bacterium]|nr:nuclear transport factor 2 family protein [Burkholderiales bacterium]
MLLKRLAFFSLCVFLLAAGVSCTRSDPQAALDAAVKSLQTSLEKKDADAVMALLHPDFSAQQSENDLEWARQTMRLMFLRYKNIHIVVFSQNSRISDRAGSVAATDAEVALTGAEGLIPDSARHYHVKLDWRLMDKQWKLIGLRWE